MGKYKLNPFSLKLDYYEPASTSGGITHATAVGTNTYTATITGVTAYADADAYLIRFTNGNTGTSTLNINGLGAKTLYRNNDGVLLGGDVWSGAEMLCVFNTTTDGFQCIGTTSNALFSYVTNDDSVTLTKGMPVYAFGGTGDRMTVKRAKNTSDATSAQTVGIVLSTSIAANQKGIIMMQGLLDGLSILPTSTWSDGDPVYLGATDGSITNVKPSAPNHLVYLGVVTTASNGSAGRMYVRVQNGYEIDELHDVSINPLTLANKDILVYESATQLWKNEKQPVEIQLAASDETTALTTGTAKVTFRMPHAMTLTSVRASLTTAQTSGLVVKVDINQNGSSVLGTTLSIDNTEKTSVTATFPATITTSALTDDAEITIDIDQIGDGTAAGLKVTIIGTRV
jgi:hypothetical protein